MPHASLVQCLKPKVSKLPHLPDKAGVGLYRPRPPCVQPCPAVKTNQRATHRAMLCCARQQRSQTRHRQVSTCAPAPFLWRRRALLLHVALPDPSATHMHAATVGPRPCTAARSCAAAAAAARSCAAAEIARPILHHVVDTHGVAPRALSSRQSTVHDSRSRFSLRPNFPRRLFTCNRQ